MTAWYQEYFVLCCGGWHASHVRVRIGSYHHYVIAKVYAMALASR